MRVLLATDGSNDARAATRWLTRFPLPGTSAIRAVSVVTLPSSPIEIPPVHAYHEALREEGRRVAHLAQVDLGERWKAVETEVREGDPRPQLAAAIAEWKPDLVVVGARGLGAVTGFLLGSVSADIVRHAPCPVLVVKGRPHALRRAVVAVDGSPDSLAGVRFVASLPLEREMALRLLAVVERPRMPLGPTEVIAAAAAPAFDVLVAERRDILAGLLARLEAQFQGRVAAVESSVVVGRPSEEIVSAAGEPGVDLVVVGTRGRGPLTRLLLGSVSERVLHHAACSVLIVRQAPA